MGIHQQLSNTKRDRQSRKCYKMSRMKKRDKSRHRPKKCGDIQDPELMTVYHLRKRRTCSRANIQLSGKKKQKILKQLRRQEKDKNAMEVVPVERPRQPAETSSTKTAGKKGGKSKKTSQDTASTSDDVMEVDES